ELAGDEQQRLLDALGDAAEVELGRLRARLLRIRGARVMLERLPRQRRTGVPDVAEVERAADRRRRSHAGLERGRARRVVAAEADSGQPDGLVPLEVVECRADADLVIRMNERRIARLA